MFDFIMVEEVVKCGNMGMGLVWILGLREEIRKKD